VTAEGFPWSKHTDKPIIEINAIAMRIELGLIIISSPYYHFNFLEVLLWIFIEHLLVFLGAEVIDLSFILALEAHPLIFHLHLTYRIYNSHFYHQFPELRLPYRNLNHYL
jgi:hypothetical protein